MEMRVWDALPSKEALERTLAALKANGIDASLAETAEEAKKVVLSLLPEGAEVFTMTSITLDQIGLSSHVNESGKYDAVRPALFKMDQKTQGRQMRKLGAAPDFTVGSAHAVTETGTVMVASMTGSQLPAYASAARNGDLGGGRTEDRQERGRRDAQDQRVPDPERKRKGAEGVRPARRPSCRLPTRSFSSQRKCSPAAQSWCSSTRSSVTDARGGPR